MWPRFCCNHSRGFILDVCVIKSFSNTITHTHIDRVEKKKNSVGVYKSVSVGGVGEKEEEQRWVYGKSKEA